MEGNRRYCTHLYTSVKVACWIRFFECLLHISYRLEVKKWQIRKQDQEKVQQRKHLIQEKFRKEMGLLVDVPKPGGSGTTNDGNTARRFFFRDPTLSVSITGNDETLIRRCSVILQALSSRYRVNATAFNNYAEETAKLFVSLYAWYYMPVSVHRVLKHGSAVVSAALLPIGQLSDETQEARNKDIKKFGEHYTRKLSRESTNLDLMQRLMLMSDPVISLLRELLKKSRGSLPSAVLALLEAPPSLTSGASASTSATVINPSDSEYSSSTSVMFISLKFLEISHIFILVCIKNVCFKQ